jgi:hypothetical protein
MIAKRIIRLIVVLMVLSSVAGISVAQDDDNLIEYGAEINGTITTRKFEDLYTFEGETGDIVIIEMFATNNANIDPQLFFATIDNDLLSSNDDAVGRDSRVIYKLPADDTYLIVATRLSGRFGTDEGDYRLRLTKVEPLMVGITHEGSVRSQEPAEVIIFAPETTGTYTINYRHIQGAYYPALSITSFSSESTYAQEVGRLDGMRLASGALTFDFQADAIYSLSLAQSNYAYSSENETAVYTLRIVEPR